MGSCGVQLFEDVVNGSLADRIRTDLLRDDRHGASEIVVDAQRHLTPRLTSSFSDIPLTLDGMQVSRPWTVELSELRDLVETRFGLTFNYALANLYRNRSDFTGWHSDKAWLHEPDSSIAIVSFGATRRLAIRPVGRAIRPVGGDPIQSLELTDSSVLTMDLACQSTHEHCIPEESEAVGKRLSITLRHIKILPEYLDRDRQRRRSDDVTTIERNELDALHR